MPQSFSLHTGARSEPRNKLKRNAMERERASSLKREMDSLKRSQAEDEERRLWKERSVFKASKVRRFKPATPVVHVRELTVPAGPALHTTVRAHLKNELEE